MFFRTYQASDSRRSGASASASVEVVILPVFRAGYCRLQSETGLSHGEDFDSGYDVSLLAQLGSGLAGLGSGVGMSADIPAAFYEFVEHGLILEDHDHTVVLDG